MISSSVSLGAGSQFGSQFSAKRTISSGQPASNSGTGAVGSINTIENSSASSNSAASQIPNTPNSDSPADAKRQDRTSRASASDALRSEKQSLAQAREAQQLLEDQRKISELSARDREVRAHEQAHAAVGGTYAGAPKYQTERGPDGVSYAVGGEVPIDLGRAATPQETILKAQIVRRAALAPAEPSPQDRKVAAQATQMESQARTELRAEQAEAADLEASKADDLQASDTATANAAGNDVSSAKPNDGSGVASRDSQATGPLLNASGLANRASQFSAISSIDSPRSGSLLSQIA